MLDCLPIFTVRNEAFTCSHCQTEVAPLKTGCRNHCPVCLYSMHLDNNPGDRQAECQGTMKPIAVEANSKKGWMIVHECLSCGKTQRNKATLDDPFQPDSIDAIADVARKMDEGR